MIVKMSRPAFALPVVIQNRLVRIEEVPAMRPESHGQCYFLAKKVQPRVIGDIGDDRRRSEKEASRAKNTRNRAGGCVTDWNGLSLHSQNSVSLELPSPHREHVAGSP